MDITICDKTALGYWRIPPVVQLLAAAPDADKRLARVLTSYDLELLSANFVAVQARFKQKHSGNAGEQYRALMEAVPFLSLCGGGPFDVMSTRKGDFSESQLAKPRLWSAPLPTAAIRQVTDTIDVTSPEFTLQQLAARESFERTLILATEFCGSFSVFHAPDPIAGILQRLCDTRKLPRIGGWSPCLDGNGRLTDLWSHEPLTCAADLCRLAETSDSPRGRKQLLRVAKLVVDGAASPFEAQAGILLGLPVRLGGAGLNGFTHNHRVDLSREATLIANQATCFCDLYWDEGLDLECHSRTWHAARDQQLSNFTRETALAFMGIDVIPLTYEQLSSRRQFDAVARILARKLGRQIRDKNAAEQAAEARLRDAVLGFDWM